MAKESPKQWWSRRRAAQAARDEAAQIAQIPVLDLRNSEQVAAPQWPDADVLDAESEARLAGGVLNIPLDFQTRTINPDRPRTIGAGYDAPSQTLRLRFRPEASRSPGGAIYDYHGVSEKQWWAVQHAISTGRFINNQLTGNDYTQIW